jgi:membrane protein DedA with SNARE-associated domain
MIGAAIWATGVSGAGYLFGHAIEWLIVDLERLEKAALVCAFSVVAVLLILRRRRSNSPGPRKSGSL